MQLKNQSVLQDPFDTFSKFVPFQPPEPHPPNKNWIHYWVNHLMNWRMNLQQEGCLVGTPPPKHCHHNSKRQEPWAFTPRHCESCVCDLRRSYSPKHSHRPCRSYAGNRVIICIRDVLLSNQMHADAVLGCSATAKIARSASALDGQDNTITAANNYKDGGNVLFATTSC